MLIEKGKRDNLVKRVYFLKQRGIGSQGQRQRGLSGHVGKTFLALVLNSWIEARQSERGDCPDLVRAGVTKQISPGSSVTEGGFTASRCVLIAALGWNKGMLYI